MKKFLNFKNNLKKLMKYREPNYKPSKYNIKIRKKPLRNEMKMKCLKSEISRSTESVIECDEITVEEKNNSRRTN